MSQKGCHSIFCKTIESCKNVLNFIMNKKNNELRPRKNNNKIYLNCLFQNRKDLEQLSEVFEQLKRLKYL